MFLDDLRTKLTAPWHVPHYITAVCAVEYYRKEP